MRQKIKYKLIKFIFVLLLSLFFVGSCSAIEITLYPTDDTNINKGDSPELPQGNYPYPLTRNVGSGIYQVDILTKFDLSSLSSNVNIQSAVLYFYYFDWDDNNPAGRELNMYRITSDWNEETTSWNTQPTYASQPTAKATIPSSPGMWMSWDVTGDVQNFVDGKENNHGWKLTDENYWGSSNIPETIFYSKEYSDNIPYLEIEYSDTESVIDETSWMKSLQEWSGFIAIIIVICLCIGTGLYFFRNEIQTKYVKKGLKQEQIDEIKSLLKDHKKLSDIKEKIKVWKEQGYNVEELDKILEDIEK